MMKKTHVLFKHVWVHAFNKMQGKHQLVFLRQREREEQNV